MEKVTPGMAIVCILFLVGVIPAGASVMKDEHTYSQTIEDYETPVSPGITALCNTQITDHAIQWINSATTLPMWKNDDTITLEGMCDDGTRLACTARSVGNGQHFDASLQTRAVIINAQCWFYHSDGSKAKLMSIDVYANGKGPVLIYERWNSPP
jgi:hypothetical protein